MHRYRKPKLGLALGSGAGKGWAHIGVLKVLHHEGISIRAISGSSAGALVAAFYAAGKMNELENFVLNLSSWRKSLRFFDFIYPSTGLIGGNKISEVIDTHLKGIDFSDLRIPVSLAAVDLISGQEVLFEEKDLHTGIRASISLPLLMKPVRYKGRLLIDGGVLHPLPVNPLRRLGADVILAVDLSGLTLYPEGREIRKKLQGYICRDTKEGKNTDSSEESKEKIRSYHDILKIQDSETANTRQLPNLGLYDIMMRTFTITQNKMHYLSMREERPNLILSPQLHHFQLFDFHRGKEAIHEGERVARQALPQIRKLLSPYGLF